MPRIRIEVTEEQLQALEMVLEEAEGSVEYWARSIRPTDYADEAETIDNKRDAIDQLKQLHTVITGQVERENDEANADDFLMPMDVGPDQAPLAACKHCGSAELLYWEQVGARRDVLRIEQRDDEGATILIRGQIDTFNLEGDDPEAYIVCDGCQREARLSTLINKHGYSVDWV